MCHKSSIFKFDKYHKLGFVSCSYRLIFFCHNPCNEMELAFSWLKKSSLYIFYLCTGFECLLNWTFFKKKNA